LSILRVFIVGGRLPSYQIALGQKIGPWDEKPTPPGRSASYRRWVRLALLAGFLAAMSVVALNYYARSGAEIIGQAPEDQPRPQSPVPAVSR
jgi:hypothetical protein